MPKPDALRRETSNEHNLEAAMRPTLDQQRVQAGFIASRHPDWSHSRCMQRALIEWQKRPAQQERKAA